MPINFNPGDQVVLRRETTTVRGLIFPAGKGMEITQIWPNGYLNLRSNDGLELHGLRPEFVGVHRSDVKFEPLFRR